MAAYLELHSPACSQPDSNRLAPGQARAAESLREGGPGSSWLPWCLTWVLACLSQVWMLGCCFDKAKAKGPGYGPLPRDPAAAACPSSLPLHFLTHPPTSFSMCVP